ncbi:MAG: methyltransferase domain-containing protein [Chloroflexi bacterium]|nr:methyltransferase domain-containing protein [Chloroflexota bacterium]MBU1749112.1 methyltransferase domain-containing protein [Chloroflexota bacterium]
MSMYTQYAQVYDESGQIFFALRMIDYLGQLLPRHGPVTQSGLGLAAGDKVLDLACGTGTVAVALAQQGLHVYGVDGSPAMIEQARCKVTETGYDVALSCQDMRAFTLPEPVDVVTCLYDSLNYLLSPADLVRAFECVRAALRPGGILLADINTPAALLHIWGADTYFGENPRVSIVMQNTYDEATTQSTVIVTGFVRRGELYERFQEEHQQRGYVPQEVATALKMAGLRLEASYDCFSFTAPGADAQRVMYVARRPIDQETRSP